MLSGAIAAVAALALSSQATAETYFYNPTSSGSDLWSAATNWNAAPVSGTDTELIFGDWDELPVNLENTNTNDLLGEFQLNILTLQGMAAISSGGTININSADPATGLTFVTSDISGLTPVVNLNAYNGAAPLIYNINIPVTLANDTLFTGDSKSTFNFSGGINGAGVTLSKSGLSELTLGGTTTLENLNIGDRAHGGTVTVATGGSLSVGSGSTSSILIGGSVGSSNNDFSGILDVSAAANFTANVKTFYVSYTGGGNPTSPFGASLFLGVSNDITASESFRIGTSSNQPTATLGGVVTTADSGFTAIKTPSMTIASGKSQGSFTVGADATLSIAGMGATPRAALTIANNTIGTSTNITGSLDAAAGIFNATLSNLLIGNNGNNNTGSVTGSLLIGTNELNHLDVSAATVNGGVIVIGRQTTGSGIGTGTMTIGNLDAASQVVVTNNGTAILLGQAATAGKAIGTLNLNGGTLKITTTGSAIAGGTNGTSIVNFNGTTIRAGATSNSWITGLTTANVAAGGANFDTDVYNVGTNQNFTGTGSLTKSGQGMLTLSGLNTYEGKTNVLEGVLYLTKKEALSGYGTPGRLTVADGAGIGVSVGGTGEFTLAELEGMRTNGTFQGSVHRLAIGTQNSSIDLVYLSSFDTIGSFAKLGEKKLTLSNTTEVTGGIDVGLNNLGGTLAVGTGPFDIGTISGGDLNIGVTTTGAKSSGILDLSTAASFSANLTNVRVGSAQNNSVTGQGTLILPANSSILAFNAFTIGSSAGAFNNVESKVTTGAGGLTTIGTTTMTIGGSKSQGTFLLGANATLELAGPFDGDRAVLHVGRSDVYGGSGVWWGDADMSAGIFKGTLSNVVIGYNDSGVSTYTETGTLRLSNSAQNHLDILAQTGPAVSIGRWISSGTPPNAAIAAVGTLTIGNLDETSSIVSLDNSTAILIGTGGTADGIQRASGTLDLNGGTLTITTEGTAISGDTVNTANVSTVNFNGTTLKAGASSANWISGLTNANIGAGGAKFDTNGFDIAVAQSLVHAPALAVADGGLTKSGEGILTVSGANSYTGATTVQAGTLLVSGSLSGTTAIAVNGQTTRLQIGAADAINDLASITLNGGSLETLGFSDTVGALRLEAASIIDLGDGSSILRFSDSSGLAWSGTLGIANWTGLASGGGTDQLFFGSAPGGLTPEQLALVAFINPAGFQPGIYDAAMLPTGEIVVIPEPGSLALLIGAAGLLGGMRRRRR